MGLVDLLGRIVSPPRCSSCEADVAPRAVFCGACASTVESARGGEGGRIAAFLYGGAIAQAVTRFKYEGRADLARPLADLLWRAVEPHAAVHSGCIVVPVPLHPGRLAERGYNQSALLAGRIARRLACPWLPLALARSRDTPRQASLGRGERLANVAGAFAVTPSSADRIRGARILLVDDVTTTGATLKACETALLGAGARVVAWAVVARAP
jgi:ComF family protein